jgi:hypothetical protein
MGQCAGFHLLCYLAALTGFVFAAEDLVLFNFESKEMPLEQMDRVTIVSENATEGKFNAKVVLDTPWSPNFGLWGGTNNAAKWSNYDQLLIDVLVDKHAVKVSGFISDKEAKGWSTRHNYELLLQPGKRRIAFSLGGLRRQNGKGNLDINGLQFFAINFASEDAKLPATIFVDNARLVKGTGSYTVKLLYSFEGNDVGSYAVED